jgi:F0F1-type ATP synthase assembly protein I
MVELVKPYNNDNRLAEPPRDDNDASGLIALIVGVIWGVLVGLFLGWIIWS